MEAGTFVWDAMVALWQDLCWHGENKQNGCLGITQELLGLIG
jgi:hypothetical protein